MPSRSSSWQSACVQAVQTPDARPAAAFCTNHNGLHLGGAAGKLFGYATNVHWCVVATTPGKDRPGRDPAPISTRAPALPLGGCPRILSASVQPIQQREHAVRVQLHPCSGLHAQRCLAPARPRRLQLRTRQFVPSAVGGGLLCAARHAGVYLWTKHHCLPHATAPCCQQRSAARSAPALAAPSVPRFFTSHHSPLQWPLASTNPGHLLRGTYGAR